MVAATKPRAFEPATPTAGDTPAGGRALEIIATLSAIPDASGLSPVAWSPEGPLDVKRWMAYGQRFVRMGSASNWWIGDWMRYGNARYGEKYGAASKATGYDRQTLMNMVYVASRFEAERRRRTVSWSHHAELAALSAVDQDSWLDLTEREHLTVRSLRDEVRRARRAPRRARSNSSHDAGAAAVRTCPLCGSTVPVPVRTPVGVQLALPSYPPRREIPAWMMPPHEYDVPLLLR